MNNDKLQQLVKDIKEMNFKNEESFDNLKYKLSEITNLILEMEGRPSIFEIDLRTAYKNLCRPNLNSKAAFDSHKEKILQYLSSI